MRKLLIGVAVVAAAMSGLSVPASADGEPIFGNVCGFSSSNDPTPTGTINQDPSHQYGVMNAGPLLLADLGSIFPITIPPTGAPDLSTPPSPSTGTLDCWVQSTPNYDFTGAPGGTYGYNGAGSSTSCLGLCLGGGEFEYNSPVGADTYLCSAVLDIGGVGSDDWLYDANWTDPDTGQVTGNLVPWNSTPTPVCSLAISAG